MSRKQWIVVAALLVAAASFRVAVAHWLANDAPDDGRIYAQMARNVLEQHVYSHATEPPYEPSLIRLPGYPLFLAAVYSIFGHGNNGAVRMAQALVDTGTCALIGLLAFYWQPNPKKKKASGIAALALVAVCPFTMIYVATILTETLTMFLLMALFVAATLALNNRTSIARLSWWSVAGLSGGLAVLMRPDAGLFVAAVGVTLLVSGASRLWGRSKRGNAQSVANAIETEIRPSPKAVLTRLILSGSTLSVAFLLVLAPWAIRNWRVFHLFQPLAPAHAEMPGEFVPHGYSLWLRTWLDDQSYIAPFLWSLDTDPIDIDDLPASAYDSAEEKARVAALLDKYNHADETDTDTESASPESSASPTPQANPSPAPGVATNPPPPPKQSPAANSNVKAADESNDEEADNEDNAAADSAKEEPGAVEMTPEIDAGFAQLARERISRHPFQFYFWLPLKRAHTMWFDSHSQYWPFEGTLMPLEDLDYETHQQIWLPLFAALTTIYTVAGLAGLWLLWDRGKLGARMWVVLTGLAILLRLILIAPMENPEPRYLVEFFPLLCVLGGIAIASGVLRLRGK